MSNYADAINQALGVTPAPAPAPKTERAAAPKRPATTLEADVGALHSGTHRGIVYVVRERGCTTLSAIPVFAGAAYWSVYFTDEELKVDAERTDIAARMQACRNAIDRMFACTPVWTGVWYQRGITLQ